MILINKYCTNDHDGCHKSRCIFWSKVLGYSHSLDTHLQLLAQRGDKSVASCSRSPYAGCPFFYHLTAQITDWQHPGNDLGKHYEAYHITAGDLAPWRARCCCTQRWQSEPHLYTKHRCYLLHLHQNNGDQSFPAGTAQHISKVVWVFRLDYLNQKSCMAI